ncbi:MAG: molybdenum cofactor guanylyltransferase [Candidatus Zixiibacteriota bacterium]|nr:MAG: molybdenum cofactor guanylyltransferase [candidate division Zixibacteria bacterium]
MMKITQAYILAGGQSRRMGRDKLFVSVDGVPLLGRTLDVCREAFARVSIVAKESAKFRQFNTKVLLDAPEADGPLAGIITALRHCSEAACFITAADLRDLNRTVIANLLQDYRGEQYLGLREPDTCQPLCGIYNVSSLPVLLAAARRGEYALHTILHELECRFVPCDLTVWRNINRPSDLADRQEVARHV